MKNSGSSNSIPKILADFQDLRTSNGSKTPRSARRTDLVLYQERYLQAVGKLSSYLLMQLEIVDVVEVIYDDETPKGGDPKSPRQTKEKLSFLAKMVQNIRELDGTFVQSKIKEDEPKFRSILDILVKNGEIDIRDDIIFTRRGAPKKAVSSIERGSLVSRHQSHAETRSRRNSFASTKFFDGDQLLRVPRLKEMSDLDYLMSLNGYHLPFYEDSTKERSMYEYFYTGFLNLLVGMEFDEDQGRAGRSDDVSKKNSLERQGYIILQECIYQIHMITEYWISAIECIIEILTVINLQLELTKKGSGAPLSTLKNAFNDPDKIFGEFQARKLLKAIGQKNIAVTDDKEKSPTQINLLENYNEALSEAIELYTMNCEAFLSKLDSFKKSLDVDAKVDESSALLVMKNLSQINRRQKLTGFINDVIVYIRQFDDFLKDIQKVGGFYEVLLDSGLGFLRELEEGSKSPKPGTPRASESPKPAREGVFSRLSSLARYYSWKK